MKGIGFDEKLLEYNKEECILSTNNNYDKYIIAGNNYINNISLVIDVNNGKYFSKMVKIAENKDVSINLLFNYEMLNKYKTMKESTELTVEEQNELKSLRTLRNSHF